MDQFADEQLDEAMALVDATLAEIEAEVPKPNLTVRAGRVANIAARSGALDDLLAILADDFVAELTDGRTVTADDIRSGSVDPAEIGFGIADRRIVSVIRDHASLMFVGLADGRLRWSVEEIDATGRLHRVRALRRRRPPSGLRATSKPTGAASEASPDSVAASQHVVSRVARRRTGR